MDEELVSGYQIMSGMQAQESELPHHSDSHRTDGLCIYCGAVEKTNQVMFECKREIEGKQSPGGRNARRRNDEGKCDAENGGKW